MLRRIKRWAKKQQFQPAIFGFIVNPAYFARKEIFYHIKFFAPYIIGHVLDVGCGSKPYENLFHVEKYTGMDVEKSGHDHQDEKIDVYYSGKDFPFGSHVFDSLVCFEVLEHIFNPNEFLKEVHRVVKPEGYFLFTVPFIWGEHEQPYDYGRYSSFGLKDIFTKNGFTVIESRKYVNDFRLFFLLLNNYVSHAINYKKKNKIRLFFTLFICDIITMIGMVLSKLFPKNNDLYFGNIILLQSKK